jgi:hypothetical protein
MSFFGMRCQGKYSRVERYQYMILVPVQTIPVSEDLALRAACVACVALRRVRCVALSD